MGILSFLDPYRNLGKSVYVIAFSRFISSLGSLVFPFMTLIMKEKVGLPDDKIGMMIAVTAAINVPAGLFGGKFADTLGRKKTIVLFNSIGILLFLLCSLIEPTMLLVYALILVGAVFQIAGPAHESLMADITTRKNRAGAYALNYLAFNLGFSISMIFAGELFAHHLRLMFIINFSASTISLLLVLFFVKDRFVPGDSPSQVSEDLHIEEGEEYERGTIFAVLWRRKFLLLFAFGLLGYRLIYSQWNFLIPLHANENFGLEVGSRLFGRLGSINALMVVLLTPFITGFIRDIPTLKRVIIAGFLFLFGFGVLGFIDTYSFFIISTVVMTVGEIIEAVSVTPYVISHTPASHRGRMSSVFMIIMSVGWSIGPLITGRIAHVSSYFMAWRVASAILILSIFVMFLLYEVEKRSQKENN